MAVTIKDIARKADVSHTTVSRALRGHPAIADETIRRIQDIAEELGYVPNSVARGLKTSRSGVLGVIVRRIVDPYFSEVLEGIEEILYAEGYSLFLASSNRDAGREKAIIRAMSERRVDGVIICSTQVGQVHRQQLGRFGVPAVLINNQAPEEIPHSIYHNDVDGSRALVEHLLSLGHRRIAYLGNARAGRTSRERLEGYEQALISAGVPVMGELIAEGPSGLPEGGEAGVKDLLVVPERPTAIVCYNDMMAIGVIKGLQGAGLSVPADCSVTGFDDIGLAAYVQPTLTTFSQPKKEIGRRAAKMILEMMNRSLAKPPSNPEIVVLRGELCVRGSTGPVNNGRRLNNQRGEGDE